MMSRANEWKQPRNMSMSSSSSFSTEGTSTITSTLRAREMPIMNSYSEDDGLIKGATTSTSSTETTYDNRICAGRDPRHHHHHRSVSPDSVAVSPLEDRNQSIARLQSNDVSFCCLHGRQCSVGRSTGYLVNNVKAPEYESVRIHKLQNPPESVTRRQSSSKHSSSSNKRVVYRCRYPSGMSSIATPSSIRNGGYENIECLNKLSESSALTSTVPVDTYGESYTSFVSSEGRHRPAGITLEDFYLGAMKKRDAEKLVKKNTFFRLYHRVPSAAAVDIDALRDQITLYIVYKTSKGDYCHFPVQRSRGEAVMGSKPKKYFHIDCGEGEKPMRFNSLDALVNNYWVYVKFNEHDSSVEHFPVPSKARQQKKVGNDDGEVRQLKSHKHGKSSIRENYY